MQITARILFLIERMVNTFSCRAVLISLNDRPILAIWILLQRSSANIVQSRELVRLLSRETTREYSTRVHEIWEAIRREYIGKVYLQTCFVTKCVSFSVSSNHFTPSTLIHPLQTTVPRIVFTLLLATSYSLHQNAFNQYPRHHGNCPCNHIIRIPKERLLLSKCRTSSESMRQ